MSAAGTTNTGIANKLTFNIHSVSKSRQRDLQPLPF
jgi:hypothetical protein